MTVNKAIIQADCLTWLRQQADRIIDLSFLDPPFNQGKNYRYWDDDLPEEKYWEWMRKILAEIYRLTAKGGAIYFMQREKNTERILYSLRESGWKFQNLIIWKKKTSAIPSSVRFAKQYQVILYATKGDKPRLFNRLRISPPLPPGYKYERENGIYVTDIWDDIRELTSGYFAGDEAIRNKQGERFHKQQSPLALLLRIILASSKVGDTVFDPFSGTGTTLVVAHQLQRNYIGIEIDPNNVNCIKSRLQNLRKSDDINKYYSDYIHTENLAKIWGKSAIDKTNVSTSNNQQLSLFN
jgi:DNA modification methylase